MFTPWSHVLLVLSILECAVVGVVGLSGLYRLYSERIAELRLRPPPDDWDGTSTATSK